MTASRDLIGKALQRRRGRPWLAWGLAIFTTVVLVDAVFGEAGYFARLRARAEYDRRVARLTAIRHDNRNLLDRSRRLDADPGAIEEAARRDLGLVRPGEILVLIKDRPDPVRQRSMAQ